LTKHFKKNEKNDKNEDFSQHWFPYTYGRYCTNYSLEHQDEEMFVIKNNKIIANIIYRRAVEIHENHENYNEEMKDAIMAKIHKKVPEIKDFPLILEYWERTLDQVCKRKAAISKIIYDQIKEKIKKDSSGEIAEEEKNE